MAEAATRGRRRPKADADTSTAGEGTKAGSKKGGTRKSYDQPIKAGKVVAELPPTKGRSSASEALQSVIDADGEGWVILDGQGRQPTSVQSSVQTAAKRAGVTVEIKIREVPGEGYDAAFARLVKEDDGTSEDE